MNIIKKKKEKRKNNGGLHTGYVKAFYHDISSSIKLIDINNKR